MYPQRWPLVGVSSLPRWANNHVAGSGRLGSLYSPHSPFTKKVEEEMTRGKGVNPMTGLTRPLSGGEIQDIQQQKAEAEASLKYATENQAGGAGGAIDKNKLKAEINRYDAILNSGAPKKVSGIQKDAMVKESQRLAEEMQKNMPTKEEMDHPARNPGAVQKHLKWEQRNLKNIQDYKTIMRTLEPDDPTNTNIDRLRKEK